MEWMGGPNFLTLKEALRQIDTGKLTPPELQRACLQQIERLNSATQCFYHGGAAPR